MTTGVVKIGTHISLEFWILPRLTGEKPPGEKLGYVRLGFRPGAFHRGANVRGAFHLEPLPSSLITQGKTEYKLCKVIRLPKNINDE